MPLSLSHFISFIFLIYYLNGFLRPLSRTRLIRAWKTLHTFHHQFSMTTSKIKLNKASCKIIKKTYSRATRKMKLTRNKKVPLQQLGRRLLGWSAGSSPVKNDSNYFHWASSVICCCCSSFLWWGSISNAWFTLFHWSTFFTLDELGNMSSSF
jgi:hypothetical protein